MNNEIKRFETELQGNKELADKFKAAAEFGYTFNNEAYGYFHPAY